MHSDTAIIWWWLNVLNRRRYDQLLSVFPDLDTALEHADAPMLRGLGMKEESVTATLKRFARFNAAAEAAKMEKIGVRLCCIEDDIYPQKLREIADPPVFLSYVGDLSVLDHPCIGVVGTRGMTPYGRRVVELFVPAFARSGCVTVSGLALGVDSAVARDTMDAGGRTVAVLGHGLSRIYPRMNERLAWKIAEKGGLLLSEYPLDLEPDIYTFPARNRIIAGVSLGTLVVEAPLESGAIITAELALEYGREVFAVPGPIFEENMAGCHRLVAEGHARLVTEPDDVLTELGMMRAPTEQRMLFLPQSDEQTAIYAILTGMPQTTDDLAQRTQLPAAHVATTLTLMELAGAAKNIGGGQWIRR